MAALGALDSVLPPSDRVPNAVALALAAAAAAAIVAGLACSPGQPQSLIARLTAS